MSVGVTLTAGGAVTLASSQNTDAGTNADGSAVGASSVKIGAAVAITRADVDNDATLPAGVIVHAHDLTVSATETVVGSGAFRASPLLSGGPVAVSYEANADTILVLDRTGNYLARVTRAPNQQSQPIVTPIAGTRDTAGNSGDGAPATAARLNAPTNFLVLPDGSILIADTGNDRIRRVVPGGNITAWAGTGSAGFSGDGGAATQARLNAPHGLALLPDGSVLIADTGNNRIRRVTSGGTISTVVGTGIAAFAG